MCTLALRSSLHLHFTGFYAFCSAPELTVCWLNWMSLPNKLKRSHTVITLRCNGEFSSHEPQIYVRSMWGRDTGVRKETWFTTDSQIVCFTALQIYIYIFFAFFFFQNLLRMEGHNVFRTAGCFLCACWSCSHFSTNWKANCSEVDDCS